MTKLTYDTSGKLSHFEVIKYESVDDSTFQTVCFDVNMQYTDTNLVVSGIMPYKNAFESGYANGYIVYSLNQAGLVSRSATTYDILADTVSNEPLETTARFYYDGGNMLKKYNMAEAVELVSNDYNLGYPSRFKKPIAKKDYNILEHGDVTYVQYKDMLNKSCLLVAPLSNTLHEHLPTFYARMLGRPSRQLPSEEALLEAVANCS